ncbi:hypothetical protein [Halorhabdus sp. CBA1104]|uniref:hypothetical protein n=1 Tax=Halorhabdus sp. CBA1104 TaxID=1380432 RepID=UPI0012B253D5|nr:hypothetical protein [Halorhabdus sp. CBA1104]
MRGKRNNDSEFTTHKNSGNKKAPKEIVENVHKKADEDVRVKRKKKSRLNNNQVDVAKKSDEVDFDVGWDDMASNDHWEEGEWGTTMGWNVQWKKAPNAESVHGVKAHVNLKPGKEHPIIKDRAEKAILKQNYNHADVFSEDYRPYNTNGQASESWSIGVTAGSDTVNVGVEHSTQHSKKDMEIHDDSAVNDPDLQNMEHTYDISNDLRKHTVRATQFGIVEVDDKDKDGEKFAYIDLQGEFKQCDIQNGYDYYW